MMLQNSSHLQNLFISVHWFSTLMRLRAKTGPRLPRSPLRLKRYNHLSWHLCFWQVSTFEGKLSRVGMFILIVPHSVNETILVLRFTNDTKVHILKTFLQTIGY